VLGCNTADYVVFVFTVDKCTVAAYDIDTCVAPVEHEYGLVMLVATLKVFDTNSNKESDNVELVMVIN